MLLYIIFYALFAFNVYLTLSGKKSKAVSVLSVMLLGFLFTFNPGLEGDHETYKDLFLYPDKELSKDLLFYYFIVCVRFIGISNYNVFLFIEFIIGLVLIVYGAKSITNNYHPMIAVAMLYIFPHCAVAIRFFLAFSIIIFSVRFFINRNTTRNKVYYIICMIIATLFHACASVFLLTIPLLFTKDDYYQRKSWQFISFLVIVVSSILVFVFYTLKDSMVLTIIARMLDEEMAGRGAGYFQSIDYGKGALIAVPIYFVGLLLSYRLLKYVKNNSPKRGENVAQTRRVISSIHCLNVIWIITMVFMFMDMTFIRDLFIPSVVVLLAYGKVAEFGGFSKKYKLVNVFLFVILLLSWEILNYIGLYSISSNYWIEDVLRFL